MNLSAFRLLRHRLFAAGGVALVLWLGVLAASPALHAWLHGHAGESDHACAVALYQHGVVSAAADMLLAVTAPLFLAQAAPAPAPLHLASPRYRLPPGHAPPAC
ncbi:MAG: hypothetical protein PHE83_11385 [Opitutaceae bacterium]|nr:hypothetical protein [Opitutaceae bacterium]